MLNVFAIKSLIISNNEYKCKSCYVKPHSSVTAQRMAHWVKDLLKAAGVDTNVFKAHSVRGASTCMHRKLCSHVCLPLVYRC